MCLVEGSAQDQAGEGEGVHLVRHPQASRAGVNLNLNHDLYDSGSRPQPEPHNLKNDSGSGPGALAGVFSI